VYRSLGLKLAERIDGVFSSPGRVVNRVLPSLRVVDILKNIYAWVLNGELRIFQSVETKKCTAAGLLFGINLMDSAADGFFR